MKILLSIIGAILWILGLILLIETAEPQDFGTSVTLDPSTNQPHPAIPRRQALVPSFPELNLVAIQGYRAVSKEQVRELYSVASYYFRQLGIGFRVNFIDLNDHPCMYYNNYSVMLQELECFKAATPRRKKLITYYMLPPWIIVNQAYGPQTALIGGIAERICGKVALGNATPNGLRDGQELDTRMPHSAVILAHEVGHLLCATHQPELSLTKMRKLRLLPKRHRAKARIKIRKLRQDTPNLMHPNANAFTSAYGGILPVLNVTKRQVRRAWVKLRKL